jgi:carboxypeptidase C (cathepsin A)
VPYNDNERWTSSMGYTVIKPWTAWMAQEDWVSRHASASATAAMKLEAAACTQRVGCPVPATSAIHSYLHSSSSQVGGYVTQYANNFTFATVRGAGHMVSEVQPMAAWSLFDRFINQKPW